MILQMLAQGLPLGHGEEIERQQVDIASSFDSEMPLRVTVCISCALSVFPPWSVSMIDTTPVFPDGWRKKQDDGHLSSLLSHASL